MKIILTRLPRIGGDIIKRNSKNLKQTFLY